jgi:hypothetical protein
MLTTFSKNLDRLPTAAGALRSTNRMQPLESESSPEPHRVGIESIAADASNRIKTVQLKECRGCGAGVYLSDNFCRLCGALQTRALEIRRHSDAISRSLGLSVFEQPRSSGDIYHPVSGPLVKVLIDSVSANLTTNSRSFTRKLIQVLFSVPIWLAIVLLSPIDAFYSARTIYGRLEHRELLRTVPAAEDFITLLKPLPN